MASQLEEWYYRPPEYHVSIYDFPRWKEFVLARNREKYDAQDIAMMDNATVVLTKDTYHGGAKQVLAFNCAEDMVAFILKWK